MYNPALGVDGTIRCFAHPAEIAVALQCIIHSKSLSLLRSSSLVKTTSKPFDLAGILTGMCVECAYKFWVGLGIAPLFIRQEIMTSNNSMIVRAHPKTLQIQHIYEIGSLINEHGLTNAVSLLCPKCVREKYLAPQKIIILTVDRYE